LLSEFKTKQLIELQLKCESKGASARIYVADVADGYSLGLACTDFVTWTKGIDYVFINAGINTPDNESLGMNQSKRIIDVNFFGAVNTCNNFLPIMRKQGWGSIVISNSIGELVSTHNSSWYSASKSAVRAWFDSVALTTKGSNIHITDLTLGFVKTPMTVNLKHSRLIAISAEKCAIKMIRAAELGKRRASIPFGRNLFWQFTKIIPLRTRESALNFLYKRVFQYK
jgi:short-subunit dehydrogenase